MSLPILLVPPLAAYLPYIPSSLWNLGSRASLWTLGVLLSRCGDSILTLWDMGIMLPLRVCGFRWMRELMLGIARLLFGIVDFLGSYFWMRGQLPVLGALRQLPGGMGNCSRSPSPPEVRDMCLFVDLGGTACGIWG